jgi:hypothetical protein
MLGKHEPQSGAIGPRENRERAGKINVQPLIYKGLLRSDGRLCRPTLSSIPAPQCIPVF